MSFHGREAVSVENEHLRVTVLQEGGHVGEIFHKGLSLNPLWIPPWSSGEPSKYSLAAYPEYGSDAESKLLMGIMGHNVCVDLFGAPSAEEAAAGLTTHGEASVVRYDIQASENKLEMNAVLPLAGLTFQRLIMLDGESVVFNESISNQTALDRPIAWTQHVTLGPPFLNSDTQFTFPAARSRTFESPEFDGGLMAAATNFDWPNLPLSDGQTVDLRTFSASKPFSRFTTHLMAHDDTAGFAVFSPEHRAVMGYKWRQSDFPWLGLWQENRMRSQPPWTNKGVTCGLEFGVSPYPESRRQMISRPTLFGAPVYRWLPAKGTARVTYSAFVRPASHLNEDAWRA